MFKSNPTNNQEEQEMKAKKLTLFITLLFVASLVLGACTTPTPQVIERTVVVTEVVTEEGETIIVTQIVEVPVEPTPQPQAAQPVTLNWNWGTEPPSLDPSLATDTTSIAVISNLFVGLTKFDPVSGEVIPSLATDWEATENADGEEVWTFHLRDDIAWVQYNPVTGETIQVTDDDGNPRFVNAHDVVYGTLRTIDPNTASDYAYVLYIVKNATEVNTGEEGFTLEDVGVAALDDWTVEFTLRNPAGYFPAIAGMWVAMPMPSWVIEGELGDRWTEAGVINTNGPYVLESWIHGAELNLFKNPLWINAADVQIERVEGLMIVEASTAFALYENHDLDTTAVPLPEMDRVKSDPVLSQEYYQGPYPCTYYFGYTNNKPPFDDVRVRTAFTQAIDRQSLIDNVLKGGQLPATTFAPPGMFGAPEPGTVGLPSDAEAAKAALQAYLDEKGMTIDQFNAMDVVLMHNTSEGHARIAAAIQQMWKDTLGVNVRVENQEWGVYLNTINKATPLSDHPHIWRLGWCADYPDENNWVHEVFNAVEGANDLRRNCADETCTEITPSRFDELTIQASRESDPDLRSELYLEAERILAAEEVAYAPIYHYTTVAVTKPWLQRNYPALGGQDFYNWKLDMAAKSAARGR
jgi:oligopeptide transport system substrate-binding protein